jgi:hypothetical protein
VPAFDDLVVCAVDPHTECLDERFTCGRFGTWLLDHVQ